MPTKKATIPNPAEEWAAALGELEKKKRQPDEDSDSSAPAELAIYDAVAEVDAIIALIDHLHRQFLQVLKHELKDRGVRDVNTGQAMIVFNIGDLEMTVGELTLSGCYLGSNVSYSVKRMLETGYIKQVRSRHDRRTVRIRLTDKGQALRRKIEIMHERHMDAFFSSVATPDDLKAVCGTLRRLGRFWGRFMELGRRLSPHSPDEPERSRQPAKRLARTR